MITRAITISDFEKLKGFWIKNYKVSKRDDYSHLKVFFDKNPNLSTLIEEKSEIIGTCLASYDGRKGYIQKVVVDKDVQGKGIGKKLVTETLKKLKKVGALDIRVACDKSLIPFYESCGFVVDNIAHLKIKDY